MKLKSTEPDLESVYENKSLAKGKGFSVYSGTL